jgi:hypothetical protein
MGTSIKNGDVYDFIQLAFIKKRDVYDFIQLAFYKKEGRL